MVVVQPAANHWHCNDSIVEGFATEGLGKCAACSKGDPWEEFRDIETQHREHKNSQCAHDGLVLPPCKVYAPLRAVFAHHCTGRICKEERCQSTNGHLQVEPAANYQQVNANPRIVQLTKTEFRYALGNDAPRHCK